MLIVSEKETQFVISLSRICYVHEITADYLKASYRVASKTVMTMLNGQAKKSLIELRNNIENKVLYTNPFV